MPDESAAHDGVRYPAGSVVAVVDEQQIAPAVGTLAAAGFLDSEVQVYSGADTAERVRAGTGRGRIAAFAIRVARHFGAADEVLEDKAQYEQALRDGRCVVVVGTPTDERRSRASDILRAHGARTIRYHGPFPMERT